MTDDSQAKRQRRVFRPGAASASSSANIDAAIEKLQAGLDTNVFGPLIGDDDTGAAVDNPDITQAASSGGRAVAHVDNPANAPAPGEPLRPLEAPDRREETPASQQSQAQARPQLRAVGSASGSEAVAHGPATSAATTSDAGGNLPGGPGMNVTGSGSTGMGAPTPGGLGSTSGIGRGSATPDAVGTGQGNGGTSGLGGEPSLGGLTANVSSQGTRSNPSAPLAGGVAVNAGRGSNLGIEGGTSGDLLATSGSGMAGGTTGGSRESDVGGGLSGGMPSAMGADASGGVGNDINAMAENAMEDLSAERAIHSQRASEAAPRPRPPINPVDDGRK
ncbi:MAG: hypothetical protein MUD01_10190 [Chloroflexaceae bacterium]|nr:hypothetical protein [Chloroflexaceae bacterium]